MPAAPTGWLELTLDFQSNLRCVGCFACDPSAGGAMDLPEVGRWLAWGRAQGLEHLWLGGGEPTLRPDLGRIVRAARNLGYRSVLLQTNGMRLAHDRYADAVIAAGVDAVSLNVKSVEPAIHDRLSGREGTWELVSRALDVLGERDVRVVADVLLTASTLPTLGRTVRELAARGVDRFWLWLLSAADVATPEVRAEVPAPADVARAIADADVAAREAGVELRSLHTPPCTLPPALRDRYWSAAALDLWVANPGQARPIRLEDSPLEGGAWLPGCDACAARPRCGGPRADVIAIHGPDAFAPIPKPVSNAFHYVLGGDPVAWPSGTACPLLERPPEPVPQRALHLKRRETLTRAATTTGDFGDAAIAAIKDVRQQVYLDVSGKPAPDDFAADLRRLVEDPACGPCPARAGCGRAFTVEATDVFGRDDRAVRDRIAALTGDVLDVGAGHGPYVELMEPLARAGTIRYVAVEPGAEDAAVLAERAPWAEVRVAAAEDLQLAEASLDHALVLRSYNHLEDPRAVLERLVVALRPGGRLLVVDNVAFALVRTAAQAARAESGPAAFEHTRNDGAAECVGQLEGLPVEVVARQDVGPSTSNQWLVEAVRRR